MTPTQSASFGANSVTPFEASVAPPAVVAPPMVATQGSTEALLAAGGPIGSGDAALFPFAPTTQREDFE